MISEREEKEVDENTWRMYNTGIKCSNCGGNLKTDGKSICCGCL